MFELITGPSGSGKTMRIVSKIVSDLAVGKHVILLVPEQMAVSAESLVCKEAERLNVPTVDLEILNFTRLCNRVLREYGGIAYSRVTKSAKSLLMWKALFSASPLLRHYGSQLENAVNFIPELVSAVSELKSYGVSPKDLSRASEEIGSDNTVLSQKLYDLALISESYNAVLGNEFTDPSDELSHLSDVLSEHHFFRGYSVYLDGFSGFTPKQYSVIRPVIRQADSVTAAICLSTEYESECFDKAYQTSKELIAMAEAYTSDITKTHLTDSLRFKNDALRFLENNIWNLSAEVSYGESTEAVRFAAASSKYSEAEFIASDITARLRDGEKYSDFAIIAGNISEYDGIIDSVFGKFSLPCHMSKHININEKPIFKLIISALNIYIHSWNNDDVIAYIKTGLTGVSSDECDEIETYTYRWSIYGKRWLDDDDWYMNPDGYTERMTEDSLALLKNINHTRKRLISPLIKLFDCLDGSKTMKEVCTSLFSFLNELGVDETISSCGGDDDIRTRNLLCEVLDTLVMLLSDTRTDAKLLLNLFTLASNQLSVGTLPATIDQITVGSAGTIRTSDIKNVYLIGVNEGIFPSVCAENSIFSDSDKAELETVGIILSPDSNQMTQNELYNFYTAVTSASESVTVSCLTSTISGEERKPSIAFNRISALFPHCQVINISELPPSQLIQNKNYSFEISRLIPDSPESAALRNIFISDPEYTEFYREDRQKLFTEEEHVSREVMEKICGGNLNLTQSRLESFVMCAFGYQCSYVLKLKENNRYEFNPASIGSLVHKVLELFFKEVSAEHSLKELTPNLVDEILDRILYGYVRSLLGINSDSEMSQRALQLFKRLRRTVRILITNIIDEFSESEFIPTFFEMSINTSNAEGTVSPLLIPLPDGSHACIYGIVDRVDICKKGSDVYVRVVDYKTGKKEFSLKDIAVGLNLQMLLYLFSIWKDSTGTFRKALGINGQIIPAGVLYYPAHISGVSSSPSDSSETVYGNIEKSIVRKGILLSDPEVLELMESGLNGKYIPVTLKNGTPASTAVSLKTLEEMGKLMDDISETLRKLACEIKSGNASALPLSYGKNHGCTYCPHKAICRNTDKFKKF